MRFLIVLLLLNVAVSAQTMLWKVSYEGKTLYLGGTVHVLRAADFPLPDAFEKAFASADTLVFETDMAALRSPEVLNRLRSQLMLPPGKTLQTVLSGQTYAALTKYVQKQDIPMELFERMKPSMVAVTLLNIRLEDLGMDHPGVDDYYFQKASKAAKRIQWFESPEIQTAMLASLGSEDADRMIQQTMNEAEEYGQILEKVIDAWRRGDTALLEQFGRKYLLLESPDDYRRLIVDRNRQWMGKLKTMIGSRETELVLVGALHLVGPDGLVEQLKRKGYRVEQMP